MSDLSAFLQDSNLSVGVFYPKHYIIATFPQHSSAKSAYQSLVNAGFSDDEIILATGDEVLEFFKRFREDAGLWGIVMRPISRFFATEVVYADQNIEQAKDGSGFIAVQSLTDQQTEKVLNSLKPFSPSSIEWYLNGGIRSLV